MSKLHDRSDFEIAVHESAHWLFAEWLHLDHANYVTIEADVDQRGHINFTRIIEISTLDGGVRQGMMLLAGWAAENIFFWQGLLNTLPDCRDKADFEELAERFFPTSLERQHQFFRGCWREANHAVRDAMQKPIGETATLLVSRRTLIRQDLDDTWQKLHGQMPEANGSICRVLDKMETAERSPA